jgi:hypothetical protein
MTSDGCFEARICVIIVTSLQVRGQWFNSQHHQEYWNSGFRRKVDGNGDRLSYYAATNGNFLQNFRTRNYRYPLRSNPEDWSSLLSVRNTFFFPTHRNVLWVLGILTYFCVLPTVRMRIIIPLSPPYVFKIATLS